MRPCVKKQRRRKRINERSTKKGAPLKGMHKKVNILVGLLIKRAILIASFELEAYLDFIGMSILGTTYKLSATNGKENAFAISRFYFQQRLGNFLIFIATKRGIFVCLKHQKGRS